MHALKFAFLNLALVIFFLATVAISFAATPDELTKQIKEYEDKIGELQNQSKTLSLQISVMNNQIKLTELRIASTKQLIAKLEKDVSLLGGKIDILEGKLKAVSEILLNRIVVSYKVGNVDQVTLVFASNGFADYISRAKYIQVAQEHDRKLLFELEQTKMNYNNQKTVLKTKQEEQKKLQGQLEGLSKSLDQQKKDKETLLTETQGSEVTYQKLLAQAEAQLAAFSKFAASQGGASILENQTSCDDWGCYYNQRDAQWGNLALNHTQFTIASDGCLVTSMAMVYTHYGHKNVTPISINSSPDNFASYYPAYLKYTITADGATSSRVGAIIDGTLASGNPVVVGVSYDGGRVPDHFVVLVSGSSGDYIMNDPFTPNGHKIPFKDHYSVASIREINKVNF